MAKAIEILEHEHRIIEQVLGSLETFVETVKGGVAGERRTLHDYVDFLQGFVDHCHHGKEEDLLFMRMHEYGFPEDFGPVAAMKAEHVIGRRHIAALAALAIGSDPFTSEERERLYFTAMAYTQLLRDHIRKEDDVLYPIAEDKMPAAAIEALAWEFDEFERFVMTPGVHETLHALAEELVHTFPPEPTKLEVLLEVVPCGHR